MPTLSEVPEIVRSMIRLSPLGRSRIEERPWRKPRTTSRKKLHASLALLPVDTNQVDFLFSRLLAASPTELPVIRDALKPHQPA